MKILWIDYDDLHNPYANGGQAYMTHEIVSRLSKVNEVTVITGNYPNALHIKKRLLSYERLGVGNLGYFTSIISHWLLLPLYILKNQSQYDVIVECFTAPFTTSLIPLVSKVPVIALPTFFDSEKLAEKYHLPLDIFKKLLLKKYHNFIVLSEELKKKILAINKNANCTVIPGGVDDAIINSKPLKGKYGLYLGRLDIYNKGLDILLEAWQDIHYPLIIAGSGRDKDKAKLKELVAKYSLTNRVKVIGYQKGKRKVQLLRNSKFVIQLSRYETFGFVALEAIAAGKSLICTDIEGYKWIRKDNAIKVYDFSIKDIKKSIEKAINEGSTIAKRQGTKKDYRWDSIAIKYMDRFHKQIIDNLPNLGKYRPDRLLTPTNQSGIFKYCLYRSRTGNIGFAKYAIKNSKANIEIMKEVQANNIISHSLNNSSQNDHKHFKLVKVLGSVLNKNYTLLMTEYIEGRSVSVLPSKTQVEIYEQAIKLFRNISRNISDSDLKILQKKSMMRYFFINQLLLLKILFDKTITLRAYFQLNIKNYYSLINYFKSGNREYGFVHGDLVNNILVGRGNVAYIYDFQTYMYTNSQYELASIYTSVSDINVFNKLSSMDRVKQLSPILLLYCGTYNYLDGTITRERYENILNIATRN